MLCNMDYCCSVAKSCLILCDHVDCSTPGSPVLHCLPEFAQPTLFTHSATPFIWCVILHEALFSTSSGRLYFPKMAPPICLSHPASSSHKVAVIPVERWGVCVPSFWIPVGLWRLWPRENDRRCVCDFWLGVLPNQALTLYSATMLWGSPEVIKSQHWPSMCECMNPLRFQPQPLSRPSWYSKWSRD